MLSRDQARYFRDGLRAARAVTLLDAEAFTSIVVAIERLGSVLDPSGGGLGDYGATIENLLQHSPFAGAASDDQHRLHTPFKSLYRVVRLGRNAAVHEGAFARNLAHKSIELALLIEDSLTFDMSHIGDFMVPGVVTIASWQPVSFARQTLLANSFSYLPIWISNAGETDWYLLSDHALAKFLRGAPNQRERRARLTMELEAAIGSGDLALEAPLVCRPTDLATEALERCRGLPILVRGPRRADLIGIATPYDLL